MKALIAPTFLAVLLGAIPATARAQGMPLCATEQVNATGSPITSPCVIEPAVAARPLTFGREEASAPASLFTRTSMHLVDVPVFKSESHAVALRFTLAGTPPVAIHPPAIAAYPPAQTLFTIHVDVVGWP